MRVALFCTDKANALQIRLDNRAVHLAHIQATGVVEMAGPLLDANGEMCGSLIVLSVETLGDAQAWAAADPYALAGLFEKTTLIEWKKVIG
ncbi:MAG: YciI family protein [Microgenomates group bacterium]